MTAMSRLARLANARELRPELDLWDQLIRRPWPAGSEFPVQLTERLAAVVNLDARRNLEPYHQRLIVAVRALAANPDLYPHAGFLKDELKRVETALGSIARQP
jgi:hypothetical protein